MTRPARQAAHVPSATRLMLTTRSPDRIFDTSLPTSWTIPGELVAHDRPVLEAGDVPVERAEVGAADRRRVDADDRVRRCEEDRIRDVLEPDVHRAAQDDGLHAGCSISTR